MGLRSKLTGGSEVNFSPEIQEYLNKMIVEVVNRSNKERDTAIANLRMEVYELKEKIAEYSTILRILSPMAGNKMLEEIDVLANKVSAIKTENCYKKFFSGDNGFLYQLADMLTGLKEIEGGNIGINEINRFYAKNFYPVSNSIIMLENSLDNLAKNEEKVELSCLPLEEIIKVHDDLSKQAEEFNEAEFPHFYRILWEAIEADLKKLCEPDYEENFNKENILPIQSELQEKIGNIEDALVNHGIEIIDTPSAESEDGFMTAANPGQPSRPLIRRAADKYIYTYGICAI